MAHNLRKDENGGTNFAAVGKTWHGLGVEVEGAMTSKEAIELAGLDYEVKLGKSYQIIYGPDKQTFNPTAGIEKIKHDGSYHTYRTDNNDILGSNLTDKYKILQNTDAFSFFDGIVGTGAAIYETAGVLGKGERIFITAKLPNHIQINGDEIDQYLLLTNSHDGKSSIQIKFTPIRVVCENTLNWALGRDTKANINITHSGSINSKMNEAVKLMGIVNSLTETATALLEHAAGYDMFNKEHRKLFIAASLGWSKNKDGEFTISKVNLMDKILDYAEVGAGQDTSSCRGTLYGLYNAVTGYTSNMVAYTNEESRLLSLTSNSSSSGKANKRALDFVNISAIKPNMFIDTLSNAVAYQEE